MQNFTRTDYVVPSEAEIIGRNLWAGSRLWAAAMAFLYIAFVFAFYYLRELNILGMWRPKGVDPPLAFGIIILACTVAAAGVYRLAHTVRASRGVGGAWHGLLGLATLLGAVAVALLALEFFKAGFRPTSGAYASVFFGWTAFHAFLLLGGVYYMECTLAKSLRMGTRLSREVSLAEVEAVGVWWYFLTLMGVLTFVLLYLVA